MTACAYNGGMKKPISGWWLYLLAFVVFKTTGAIGLLIAVVGYIVYVYSRPKPEPEYFENGKVVEPKQKHVSDEKI